MKTTLIALAAGIGTFSPIFGGEPSVRIEVQISEARGQKTGERTRFRKREAAELKQGAEFSILAAPGKKFRDTHFQEFVAPTEYSLAEVPDELKVTHREDGSMLLESVDAASAASDPKLQTVPALPATPSSFKAFLVGWEIKGTPSVSRDGLVHLELEILHHDARLTKAHYGEGTGPMVAKGETLFGKDVEVVISENKAVMASTNVTRTPLILRARPGVAYPIEVMAGDQSVAATIRCIVSADEASDD